MSSRHDDRSDLPDDEADGGADSLAASKGFAGSWDHARPRFDSPMTWSIPLLRVASISVRVHLLFLLFVAAQLLRSAFPASDPSGAPMDLRFAAVAMALLFVIVLLHEFGHCIACRRWGGVADEILMWPLGGLASCSPPRDWRAHFWTTAGGPLVNVAIVAITMPLLGFLTGTWWGVAIPKVWVIEAWPVSQSWGLTILFLANWIALVLLLFNLVPLFPLDGGRLLQAILWPRLGYAPSMRVACRAGFVGAIVLGVLGFWRGSMMLMSIAIFGAFTCVVTLRQLDFTEEVMGYADADGEMFATASDFNESEPAQPSESDRERRKREDEGARRARDEAEFDGILDKIRQHGIGSLSAGERRVLERETERRRKAGG